eukprot:3932745-Rhodomonas_salina.2
MAVEGGASIPVGGCDLECFGGEEGGFRAAGGNAVTRMAGKRWKARQVPWASALDLAQQERIEGV